LVSSWVLFVGAFVHVADCWKESAYDWDIETREMLAEALRPSTIQSYNGVLKRFESFCSTNEYPYFPTTTAAVAHFMRTISESSERPGPKLITTIADILNATMRQARFFHGSAFLGI